MKLIQKLSEQIEEEIADAKKYIKCAMSMKDDHPEISRTYYNLALQELEHSSMLHDAVTDEIKRYKEETDPYIYNEYERLENLKAKHKDAQLTMYEMLGQQRKKSEKEREIDDMFESFFTWEKDSIEIKDNPYIQIIAVITGVN